MCASDLDNAFIVCVLRGNSYEVGIFVFRIRGPEFHAMKDNRINAKPKILKYIKCLGNAVLHRGS